MAGGDRIVHIGEAAWAKRGTSEMKEGAARAAEGALGGDGEDGGGAIRDGCGCGEAASPRRPEAADRGAWPR